MSDIDTIQQIAKNEAFRISRGSRVVDRLGNDHDDYCQLFWKHGVEALRKGSNIKSVKNWAFISIRNERIRKIHHLSITPHMVCLDFSVYEPFDLESKIIFKDLLIKLKGYFTTEEWGLLLAYFEHGSARSAWLASDKSLSRRGYFKRIDTLRARCRKILSKIS